MCCHFSGTQPTQSSHRFSQILFLIRSRGTSANSFIRTANTGTKQGTPHCRRHRLSVFHLQSTVSNPIPASASVCRRVSKKQQLYRFLPSDLTRINPRPHPISVPTQNLLRWNFASASGRFSSLRHHDFPTSPPKFGAFRFLRPHHAYGSRHCPRKHPSR